MNTKAIIITLVVLVIVIVGAVLIINHNKATQSSTLTDTQQNQIVDQEAQGDILTEADANTDSVDIGELYE